jgi:sarcosine oxidase
MTADNVPLVGPAATVDGLWIAEALWITHAGGGAQVLVDLITGREPAVEGSEALSPSRFAGHDADELSTRALDRYRRIWMPVSPSPAA